jgi:inositol hexakisphosphate/diphosphoinositol-pentakisphosphate kinase
MQNILQRLNVNGEFEIVYFTQKVILEDPVDNWPEVDCLIAFFSTGFPLLKAIEYVSASNIFS